MTHLQHYFSTTPEGERCSATIAYLAALDHLESCSPEVARSIVQELEDQRSHLKLIASENFCSLATQLAMGNLLTDKYSEGYIHHRFYAGCDNVDDVEEEAAKQLKEIYGCDHAYVQPHSGSDANLLAFWSILVQRIQSPAVEELGKKNIDELTPEEYEQIRQHLCQQKVMGMSLNSGGHLTHGYRHNFSSKMMQAVAYDVDPQTGLLDYEVLRRQVLQEKPTILLAGYSAYPRRLNFATMRDIADSVGAVLLVDMAHFSGLVAGKVFTGEYDPVPYAHMITSTSHKTLRGPRGGFVLCSQEFADIVDKGCPLVLGGPLPHMMAAKAVAFQEANTSAFKEYAHCIVENAQALANRLQSRGLSVLTGGTDNHLIIVDVSSLGLTGRQGENALRKAKITVNRNAIPFDINGPWYTSGLRIGTPAITTLGMGIDEMHEIADIIIEVLENTSATFNEKTGKPSKAKSTTPSNVLDEASDRIATLLQQYPLYPEIPMITEST